MVLSRDFACHELYLVLSWAFPRVFVKFCCIVIRFSLFLVMNLSLSCHYVSLSSHELFSYLVMMFSCLVMSFFFLFCLEDFLVMPWILPCHGHIFSCVFKSISLSCHELPLVSHELFLVLS